MDTNPCQILGSVAVQQKAEYSLLLIKFKTKLRIRQMLAKRKRMTLHAGLYMDWSKPRDFDFDSLSKNTPT